MATCDENFSDSRSFFLESLYCEEEVEVESLEEEDLMQNVVKDQNFTLCLVDQDLFWEDEELVSLFSKEKQTHGGGIKQMDYDAFVCVAREEVVDWMLKVKAHYGFSTLTAVLAINFFDRLMLSSLHFQEDKPWMIQLVAVTCLSLAAKVDEVQVPLLLDLQVQDSKFVFEAKTIQRMELLVMSTLEWRMNPVTPLSFLDHIIRRLEFKTDLGWNFFKKCEDLILSVVVDWRSAQYLPSTLATSTMLHVIHQVEPLNAIEYEDQLFSVFKTTKEEINECYMLVVNISNTNKMYHHHHHKRKYNIERSPSSPSGVIDASFSYESSNDSWESSSVCSSPDHHHQPLFKKIRLEEDDDNKLQIPSVLFEDFVGSSPYN